MVLTVSDILADIDIIPRSFKQILFPLPRRFDLYLNCPYIIFRYEFPTSRCGPVDMLRGPGLDVNYQAKEYITVSLVKHKEITRTCQLLAGIEVSRR
jgi:hypothetical protein